MASKHQGQKKSNAQALRQRLDAFTSKLVAKDDHKKHADLKFPHYHRTRITHNHLIPSEDAPTAFSKLMECLRLRRVYMERSKQEFCNITSEFLNAYDRVVSGVGTADAAHEELLQSQNKPALTTIGKRDVSQVPHIENPWDVQLPRDLGHECKMRQGIVEIYDNLNRQFDIPYPTYDEHVDDLQAVWEMVNDGPTRSFADKRLSFLRSKFEIHINLNAALEEAELDAIPRCDFYSVLKVDTHIHAAACMTSRALLNRIDKAVEEEPDVPVLPNKVKDDPPTTLRQLLKQLNIHPNDLSIDSLDVHADRSTMNRFDRFDNLYNIAGEAFLRKVFLKPTKNLVRGRYFAEMVKDMLDKREDSKYMYSELRISPGDNVKEWTDLANWTKEFGVYSDHNRWVLQVPRSYPGMFKEGSVKNFEEFLAGNFIPMFLATLNPQTYPEIAMFLQYVCAMDSVSDESKQETPLLTHDLPKPDEWNTAENPPYAYYIYYMHANLTILNQLREQRGMNIIKLRPHAGESGSTVHLASTFLLAENISHGIQLTQNPALEYLWYLAQIHIAMSPLSNNALFLPYTQHPLKRFFSEGIPVTVSTDDPLMFHLTSEPLAEEYAVASQVFGLSSCDQCELARNSVVMCGFPEHVKQYWLGKNFREPGISGNDAGCTNVANVRVGYRFESLCNELYNLAMGGHKIEK